MTAQIIRFPRPKPTSPEQAARRLRVAQRLARPDLSEAELDQIDQEMAPLVEKARAEIARLERKP